MKHYIATLFAMTAVIAFCHAGTAILPPDYWKAMQDVSHFHALQSETNLPPEISSACADAYPQRRLLWAVTDGRYYVLHHEYVPTGFTHTNYSVWVATLDHPKGPRAGYTEPFKDYKTFVSQCHGFLGSGF
jgi:hypothetical protein